MFILYALHSQIILAIKHSFLATLNSFGNMVGRKYVSKQYTLFIIILTLIYSGKNDDILSYLFIHTGILPKIKKQMLQLT